MGFVALIAVPAQAGATRGLLVLGQQELRLPLANLCLQSVCIAICWGQLRGIFLQYLACCIPLLLFDEHLHQLIQCRQVYGYLFQSSLICILCQLVLAFEVQRLRLQGHGLRMVAVDG